MFGRTACLLLVLLAAGPAHAETLLHLTQSATVTVPPDELDATLRAQVVSPRAADAQRQVNAMIADALAQARQVSSVTVATGGYSVWRVGPTPQDHSERWQASQTLQLKSHDGPALLTLTGALQQKGLATEQLAWRLSREAEEKAHDAAMKQALGRLRARVEQAAELLGLRFDSFKSVQLGSPSPPPYPRLMGAMAMSAAAAPPPSAVAEDVPVTASIEADAVLLPR
jgi:predicted secreted protein